LGATLMVESHFWLPSFLAQIGYLFALVNSSVVPQSHPDMVPLRNTSFSAFQRDLWLPLHPITFQVVHPRLSDRRLLFPHQQVSTFHASMR
jgi:hypothetical protein